MLSTLKGLLAKVFGAGTDAFWKGAPWIFLSTGVSALLLAYVFLDDSSHSRWQNFLVGTGSLLLSAGVFAVLLKSFQYIRVFRDEILGVFQEKEFENILSSIVRPTPNSSVELRGLVEPLVERFARQRTKELSEGAILELGQVLSIFDQDSFYRNFSRTIRIQSYNPSSHQLRLEDELFIELVPIQDSAAVIYRSSVTSKNSNFSHGSLLVNDQDYGGNIEIDGHTVKYELHLSGSAIYRIRRHYDRTIDVEADPYIHLRITRPALDLNLRVENGIPDQINVIARGVGFDNSDPHANFKVSVDTRAHGEKTVTTTRLSKRSLTLPDNGYFVIFGVLQSNQLNPNKSGSKG